MYDLSFAIGLLAMHLPLACFFRSSGILHLQIMSPSITLTHHCLARLLVRSYSSCCEGLTTASHACLCRSNRPCCEGLTTASHTCLCRSYRSCSKPSGGSGGVEHHRLHSSSSSAYCRMEEDSKHT